MPGYAAELCGENARLRDTIERQRMLLEDKDANIADWRSGSRGWMSDVRRVPGAKSKQPPARTLLQCLRHREANMLRFLTDTAISPTSNQPNTI